MDLSLGVVATLEHFCPDFVDILLQLDYNGLLALDFPAVFGLGLVCAVFELPKSVLKGIDFLSQPFPNGLVVSALCSQSINFSLVVLRYFSIVALGLCLQLFFV